MSSRYTPNPGDNRYPRDRSPPRFDRRPPADARVAEESFNQHAAPVPKPGLAREPPRGPKAQVGRGAFPSRGKGFGPRADSWDREARDDTYMKNRGRGQEWDSRDRFDARDRRPVSPSRVRSRSPYRETRDADLKFRYRDARDGPPPAPDPFPGRGRGAYRGRGRGDWEGIKGRPSFGEDRERDFDPRASSRDRQWDLPRAGTDVGRREDADRGDRERERDEQAKYDPVGYRSDSRSSYGGPRSTTAPDAPLSHSEQPSSNPRPPFGAPPDHDRKPHSTERALASRDGDRDAALRRAEPSRNLGRANSPPPAPSVPAFGSVLPNLGSNQDGSTKTAPQSEGEQFVHPARRPLLDPAKDGASGVGVLNAPTAPKAQQRVATEDPIRRSPNMPAASLRGVDLQHETGTNWSKRFPPQSAPLAPRSLKGEQPSVRKALEEEGKNGNISASMNRSTLSTSPVVPTSTLKIPTGPRAGAGAPPSIRGPMQQPSIRAPMGRGGPTMLGRGRGQGGAWSWTNPALRQPVAPRGPSIMNKSASKQEVDAENAKHAHSPPPRPAAAIEQWRQKHENTFKAPDEGSQILQNPTDINDRSFPKEGTVMGKLVDEDSDRPSEDATKAAGETPEDNETDLALDDDDLQRSHKIFEKAKRQLEARKPPDSLSDPGLLQMLEELEALAMALKTFLEDPESVIALQECQVVVEEQPAPQIEEDALEDRSDQGSNSSETDSVPGTPPLDSLPFLEESTSTLFSELEDSKTSTPDEDELVKGLVYTQLEDNYEDKLLADQDARQEYSRIFRPWRLNVDSIEAAIREESANENSTPPDTNLEALSVPQTVRSRRIVSDYGIEAIIRESVETAAKEDQARREREEREAQIYVSADTWNGEREAEIPAMLSLSEMQDSKFEDFNDFILPELALEAFRYVPPKDDFTKKEHNEFLYHYVTMPKRFGDLAEKLEHRDYKACVRHYYASKRSTNYKNHEVKFFKSNRGKRMREAGERAAGVKPRGGLLAGFDGPVEEGASSTAASLTESGRPRRAAAPTFGESGEGENGGSAVQTPGRRSTVGKDAAPPSQLGEKPAARRGKGATGQKPGRKPKSQQLLAAAPSNSQTPSPMKDLSQGDRISVAEAMPELSREEDHQAAQLLASLPKTSHVLPLSSAPAPAWPPEHIQFGRAPTQDPSTVRRAEQAQQQSSIPFTQPQSKPHSASETTSYWSVPEKQDFMNYVKYFGTNWTMIAQTMKTKSVQMIKNYYLREIDPKKGDKGRELEQIAKLADERRSRGEDMGPMPMPTPAQPKRRYESHGSRDHQRPLAPVDLVATTEEQGHVRPAKAHMSPPNPTSIYSRVPASSNAEQKAAASSAQVLAQGPQSPTNRGLIHLQQPQQRPQDTPRASAAGSAHDNPNGGQMSPQSIEHSRRPDPEKADVVAQSQVRNQRLQAQQQQVQTQALQQQQQQQEQRERQQHQQQQQHLAQQRQTELQIRDYLEQREHQERERLRQAELRKLKESEARDQVLHAQMRQQQSSQHHMYHPLPGESFATESGRSARYDQQPRVQVDELSRRILEQRQEQRQEELRKPPEPVHRHSQGSQPPPHHVLASGSSGFRAQQPPTKSPATPAAPAHAFTRIEESRPSSVPVPASMSAPPVQPAAPPKKTSSIMSLLNSEPEEPKPKRMSDTRPVSSTPEPSSATSLYAPGIRPPSQQFTRSETPSHLAHAAQGMPLSQQLSQQQRLDPSVRPGAMARSPAPSMQRQLPGERPSHASLSQSNPEAAFLVSGQRPSYLQSRDGIVASPPPTHSRNSSYGSLTQSSQPPRTTESRLPISEPTAASRLRPSPYRIPPNQPTQPQNPSQPRSHSFHPSQSEREAMDDFHRRSLDHYDRERQRQLMQETPPLRHRDDRHDFDREAMHMQQLRANQQQHKESQEREFQVQQELRLRRRQEQELEARSRGHPVPPPVQSHHLELERMARLQQEEQLMRERERQQRGSRPW